MSRTALLLTEDEELERRFKSFFRDSSVELRAVSSPEKKLRFKPDIIVFDLSFSFKKVESFVDRINRKKGFTPLLLVSDREAKNVPNSFLSLASGFLGKDDDSLESLVKQVEELVENPSSQPYPHPENDEKRAKMAEEYDKERLKNHPVLVELAKTARNYFGTDSCYIGLVEEDREKFLVYLGEDVDTFEREATICTYGILDQDLTVVKRVQEDPRFRYISQLEERDINSYIGAPLVDREGFNIGMLCLVNDEELDISEEDKEILNSLSDITSKLLETLKRM